MLSNDFLSFWYSIEYATMRHLLENPSYMVQKERTLLLHTELLFHHHSVIQKSFSVTLSTLLRQLHYNIVSSSRQSVYFQYHFGNTDLPHQ